MSTSSAPGGAAASNGARMSEGVVWKQVMLRLSRGASRLFRNNTGTGWVGTGKPFRVSTPTTVKMYPGDVLLRSARPLHAGLCTGSSDGIGWHSVVITPEMVGQKFARFLAVETKAPKGGRIRPEQAQFIQSVLAAGGVAGVARSADEASALLAQPLMPLLPAE